MIFFGAMGICFVIGMFIAKYQLDKMEKKEYESMLKNERLRKIHESDLNNMIEALRNKIK